MTTPTITAEALLQAIDELDPAGNLRDRLTDRAAELTAARASEGQGEARNASGMERGVTLPPADYDKDHEYEAIEQMARYIRAALAADQSKEQ